MHPMTVTRGESGGICAAEAAAKENTNKTADQNRLLTGYLQGLKDSRRRRRASVDSGSVRQSAMTVMGRRRMGLVNIAQSCNFTRAARAHIREVPVERVVTTN